MHKVLLIPVLLLNGLLLAQTDTYLSDYSLSAQQDNIVISWTTSEDFRCEDVRVEHAIDTASFQTVFTFPGVCGVEGKEADYFHVFKDVVFNRTNYFRINLGIYGYSNILESTIVKRTGLKPIVIPNPASLQSVIHFSNLDKNEATVTVYDVTGKRISSEQKTIEDKLELSRFTISKTGYYWFTVELNGTISRSRFFFN